MYLGELTDFRGRLALSAVSVLLAGMAAMPCSAKPSVHHTKKPLVHAIKKPPVLNAALQPDLGVNTSLHGKAIFPPTNPWNQDISKQPVDPNSDALVASMGRDTPLHPDFGTTYNGMVDGFQYVVVAGTQPRVPVAFDYQAESDPGPYPLPPDAPIEGGPNSTGDRHTLVIDRDRWQLYEIETSVPVIQNGRVVSWKGAGGAKFDLTTGALRPLCWTSADAAGLPIFPGLVRYDEVFEQKAINHALRFTVVNSRHAYVYPARHYASSKTDPNLPPMGMRVRLKADYDISRFPPEAQVILTALKKYGMFMADNGSNMFVSGVADPRWNDDNLGTLKRVKASDFEVVKMDTLVTTCP